MNTVDWDCTWTSWSRCIWLPLKMLTIRSHLLLCAKKNWHINKQFNSKMDRYCDIFQLENLFHGNLDHVYKKQDLVTMHMTVCVWNSKNESFSVCFLFDFVESFKFTWEHRMCSSVPRFSFVPWNSQSENQIQVLLTTWKTNVVKRKSAENSKVIRVFPN